ncbi:hypothetical protein DPMN_005537 [Dreissena polymorpha]|uniref:Ubiquitin-like modifier-activating enzyme ATG7 n=1 Tax=Dreissena polymorpha TaxID=45954 RepID=A0A9D4RTZ9_DREPO|nr:hypothetical protein DPMN_005537 [Dreissena polymorpha]
MADNRTMPLQFAPFSSFLDGGFWHQLCHNKVNVYGLDDSARPINASYYNGDASGMPCRMSLEHSSFDMSSKTPSQYFRAEGHLYNKNTLEDFKNTDKKQLLDQEGAQVWKAITSGAALENTTQLSRLLLLTFADIKKYHFYYWFAFPCVCPAQDFTLVRPPQTLLQAFTPEQADQILERYREFQSRGKEGVAFFIIVEEACTLSVDTLASTERHMQKGHKVRRHLQNDKPFLLRCCLPLLTPAPLSSTLAGPSGTTWPLLYITGAVSSHVWTSCVSAIVARQAPMMPVTVWYCR